MRVLMINHEFPPIGGGGGFASYYIARELVKQGCKVDMVTPRFRGLRSEKVGGINVHRIRSLRRRIDYSTGPEMLCFALAACHYSKKLIKKKRKPDVLHAFFTLPSGLAGYFLRRKFKIPLITRMGGSDVPGYNPYRFRASYKLFMPAFRKIWKHSDALVVNSHWLGELFEKSEPGFNYEVIYNGIDLKKFSPGKGDGRTILCVSRLTKRKGVGYLLEAMKGVDAKLWIVGDGPERASLEKLANRLGVRHNTEFFGRVDHTRLPKFYASADIFVIPSLAEGMSNTALEAMGSGLPMITTDVGGSAELINGNGFVVPLRNAAKLREKIQTLLTDNKLRNSMAKKSREIAEKEFDWKEVAKEYIKLYKDVS